ncbi:hypothetical protein IYY11_09445 [Methylocystis sp. H62]|uniref:hypothetical protein n=1 Tax=Methylocystis sp. H62 TaxID=2785789 RepID=UPI0018C1EA32|nr:hypothetical protein [Methylocystis sp. H62]MBG0793600.1 hypothetical protein [Methylocystis sp. H62]
MPDEIRLNTANIVLLQQMATHGACIETIDAMFKGRAPHTKIAARVRGEAQALVEISPRGASIAWDGRDAPTPAGVRLRKN